AAGGGRGRDRRIGQPRGLLHRSPLCARGPRHPDPGWDQVNDDRDTDASTPPAPRLGAAAEHRAAAEQAANRRDYDSALRERFRAVRRALEQAGTLPVRRSRTAQETADDATTALPLEHATELHPAARSFDEVVYGGRAATED